MIPAPSLNKIFQILYQNILFVEYAFIFVTGPYAREIRILDM